MITVSLGKFSKFSKIIKLVDIWLVYESKQQIAIVHAASNCHILFFCL
jgi:hypothetical protein